MNPQCPDYDRERNHFWLVPEDKKRCEDWYKEHGETGCKFAKLRYPFAHSQDESLRDVGVPPYSPIYEFTMTGIGLVTEVKCCCGAHLDFTDYDSF